MMKSTTYNALAMACVIAAGCAPFVGVGVGGLLGGFWASVIGLPVGLVAMMVLGLGFVLLSDSGKIAKWAEQELARRNEMRKDPT